MPTKANRFVTSALLSTPLEDRHALAQRLQEVALDTRLPLRQVIALPLVFRQTRVGVIYVFRAALNVAFTQEEQDLLKAFADQAAIKGETAGPFKTDPSGAKCEPWHEQSQHCSVEFQATSHPECVQTAECRWSFPAMSQQAAILPDPRAGSRLGLGKAHPGFSTRRAARSQRDS